MTSKESRCTQGVIRPSDTTEIRLLETNFLVEEVQSRSSGHRYLKVVWEDGDTFDELLDEDPSHGRSGGRPDRILCQAVMTESDDSGHVVARSLRLETAESPGVWSIHGFAVTMAP